MAPPYPMKLTTSEILAVQSALWQARSMAFGDWKLTDDGMFGEIAFEAETKFNTLDSAMKKLKAAGIFNPN
jgi:hypothetical protein